MVNAIADRPARYGAWGPQASSPGATKKGRTRVAACRSRRARRARGPGPDRAPCDQRTGL